MNYAIKEIKNAEDVLMLIRYLKEPRLFLYYNNNPQDLNSEELMSEVNKEILAARVTQYIEREARLSLNMNRIYGIF